MRGWVGAAVATAMLVGAWFVSGATPDGEKRLEDPFVVPASVGVPTEGRNIGIEVTSLVLADRVTTGGWFAEGTFLVVALDAWAVRTESPAALSVATLVIGDDTYSASERPGAYDRDSSLAGLGLFLEHPLSGSIVFEVPADAASAHGVLRLALTGDVADSVVEVPIDFAGVEHRREQALPDVDWTHR